MKKVIVIAVIGFLGFSAANIFTGCNNREKIVQPIQYNHLKHVGKEGLGLDCDYCHQGVKTETYASIPETQVCMDCHSEAVTQSSEEEKIRQFAKDGGEIPWQRIYDVPEHVFFSHRRHVVSGHIECETCHGKMAERSSPPPLPLNNITMDFCLDCHNKSSVAVDCVTCHR